MNKTFQQIFFLFAFLFCFSLQSDAQEKFTISGYVKEASTGEALLGANVYVKESLQGTTTNQYGFYSLTVNKGNYTLVVSFIGFIDKTFPIVLDKNLRMNTELENLAIQTQEAVVEGERKDKNVQSAQMSVISIPVEQAKKLPSFLGEVDLMKTIQLMPGIQSAGEGNSGFYVRGGGPDQNLILLDEAVVYNAAHLFGFFSVFNADAVKNLNLYKGGMPAEFGGRLSSVIDISMKEGNSKSYHAEGGIGLIASRLTIQGPIKKDTSSFIISARRTYIDILLKPLINKESAAYGSGYYFYDLNAKINYRLSDKDRLFLSGYFGRDVFSYKNKDSDYSANIPWGNATGSLRWNHLFNDKLFVNTSVIFSDYKFGLTIGQDKFEFGLFSGITDYNGKLDFTYFPHIKHKIKFGLNYVYHNFAPSHATAKASDTEFDLGPKVLLHAHDGAVYLQDDYEINSYITVNAGLRYSGFQFTGPFTRYIKDQNNKTVDSVSYSTGDNIKTYSGAEPRMSVKVSLSKRTSLKASYTENYQYIHLATMASVTLPTDTWMPSTDIVKPQFGRQYAFGIFRNFADNKIETSFETYYKKMKNMIEYEDGFAPGDNVKENPDNNFVFGEGESYGGEFFINKKFGKFTGWIGYTISWTKRTFPDLNAGAWFYARYDRRHDVSVVATYEASRKFTFSAVFVYGSGNAITVPVSRYNFEGNIVSEYGERNGFRMKPYHRADIAVTYTPDRKAKFDKKKQKTIAKLTAKGKDTSKVSERKFHSTYESSFTLSVYNVYNRKNPFFIYFDDEGDITKGTLEVQAKQVSLFPVMPSITWNFKF